MRQIQDVGQRNSIMFISPTNSKRFTLYHMDEGEIYIQDFFGSCSFTDWYTDEVKINEKGKFYLCSKSIVFESDNRQVALSKHKFECMTALPTFKENGFLYTLNKTTAIRSAGLPPEPFLIVEKQMKAQVCPSFENVRNLREWIELLFDFSRCKQQYDAEDKIYALIVDKFNKRAFNMSLIQSMAEKPLVEESNILVRRVLPLSTIYGYLFLTDEQIYFEPFHALAGNVVDKIRINKIGKLFRRRYELREIGLEIITDRSFYFTFANEGQRNRIYGILARRVPANCVKIEQLENITLLWQTKQITNYDYLMHLNQAGNRSFSDLSQYPVFPWVLRQYDSDSINLNDPAVYRDLSKPIGALNTDRLQGLLARYEGMDPPKFLYGSHYSTPGYVIGYLVRKKPQYMLKLQSGRFDKPDRLFKGIKDDWVNVMENPTSLKELIPQFYQEDTSFLKNTLNLDLGVRQNQKRVADVKLPKWAKDGPQGFLRTMRQALESDYVSDHLHEWIDLVFGYKQRGREAIKAHNLFHHYTYEGMVDIEAIQDPVERTGIKCQINEFGQCPKQIFKIPHPSRSSTEPLVGLQLVEEEKKEEWPMMRTANVKYMEPSSQFAGGKAKVKTVVSMGRDSEVQWSEIHKGHKSAIVKVIGLGKPNCVLTIGQDGFLKIFDVYEKVCLKSFKICEFTLSSLAVVKADETYAVGAWDNCIYLFNIVYGSKSKAFPAHDNSVVDICYLPQHKMLASASWDCSVKLLRYVGSQLDPPEPFFDNETQLSSLAANPDETILALGDIDGNVIGVSIEDHDTLFTLNINSQKIARLDFILDSLIVGAETEVRLLDLDGSTIASYQIDQNNGIITALERDSEHLFICTSRKQFILYDVLQQKRIGHFFNDFNLLPKDRLPDEKTLTCAASGNDGLFIVLGGESGSLYVLRS